MYKINVHVYAKCMLIAYKQLPWEYLRCELCLTIESRVVLYALTQLRFVKPFLSGYDSIMIGRAGSETLLWLVHLDRTAQVYTFFRYLVILSRNLVTTRLHTSDSVKKSRYNQVAYLWFMHLWLLSFGNISKEDTDMSDIIFSRYMIRSFV